MTGSVKAFLSTAVRSSKWGVRVSSALSRKYMDSLQNLSLGLGAPD